MVRSFRGVSWRWFVTAVAGWVKQCHGPLLTAGAAIVVAVSLHGCATTRGPVSKLVNGRVVITRPISPEAYAHVTRALLYEEEQRWEDAARELQRALPFDDEAAEVRAHLADVFIRLDRIDDAAEQVRRSLQIADTVDGRLAAAHVAEARHDDRTALAQYQTAAAVSLSDDDATAVERTHLALADAQLAALNVSAAYQTVRALRDAAVDSVQARVELAALAWAMGRLPEAEAALNEALHLEPAELDARLMMAALLVAEDRIPQAKAAFREALERSEESVDVAETYLKWLVARGDRAEAAAEADRLTPDLVDETTFESVIRIERAAGRLALVKRAAAEAIKRGASPARVSLLVSGALLDAKDRVGAAAELARIPGASPDFVESRLRIAEALREMSGAAELERAGHALDEATAAVAAVPPRATEAANAAATAVKPGAARVPASAAAAPAAVARDWTADLAVARALWEEKRGDAVRAAQTLDAVLSKDPDNQRLLLVRAAIDERRGEWRHALRFAEKILALDARQIEALNFHGFISVDHDHELPLAVKRLQVAMALDPGAGGIVDSLGWAYLRGGDLARAAEFLNQANRLEPGDPEIQAHLADLFARKQDVGHAIAMYRQALTSDPPERLAREIAARLRELEAKTAAKTSSGVGK